MVSVGPGNAWPTACYQIRLRTEIAFADLNPGGGRPRQPAGVSCVAGLPVGSMTGNLGSSCGLASEPRNLRLLGQDLSITTYNIKPVGGPTRVVARVVAAQAASRRAAYLVLLV